MSKGIENIRLDDDFYKLLRLSLRLTQEFIEFRNNSLSILSLKRMVIFTYN